MKDIKFKINEKVFVLNENKVKTFYIYGYDVSVRLSSVSIMYLLTEKKHESQPKTHEGVRKYEYREVNIFKTKEQLIKSL